MLNLIQHLDEIRVEPGMTKPARDQIVPPCLISKYANGKVQMNVLNFNALFINFALIHFIIHLPDASLGGLI